MLIAAITALLLHSPPDYRAKFPLPDLTVPSGWGVNVNLKDMDDASIQKIADLGAKWIRLDLAWSRVEQSKGNYDFSRYDPVMDGLSRRGLRAILILDYGNKVYDVDAPRTREGRAAFAAYASEAVKHYRHRGVIWEVWNEPNLSHFWRGEPSAAEYSALVRVVVPAMRTVSSDEWIIGPGASRFDTRFLEGCFQKGVLGDFDAISIHPYRDLKPPEGVDDDWASLRSLVAQYAPAGKKIPLLCSEWGYSTFTRGVSEKKQGNFAIRAYLNNLAAGVPLTILYSWRDRPDASNEKEQHFGIVDSDVRPKGGFDTVQNLLGSLDGFTLDSRVPLGDDGNMALLFRKGTSQRLVTWTNNVMGQDVRFPANIAWFATNNNRSMHLTDSVQVLTQK